MSNYKLVPLEPTQEMLAAGVEWCGMGLGADEAKGRAFTAYRTMIAAAPEVECEPSLVAWVLFDATADKKYIKMHECDGSLALFDSEADAQRAKRLAPGTDYKRCEYYTAPQPAQDAAGARCARCEQGTGPKMCGDFAIHPTSYDGSPHPQDICNWCGHTRECHARRCAPDVSALVDAASMALSAIGEALNEAYNNCGSQDPEWSESDLATMEKFGPIHRKLETALSACRNKGES